MSLSNQTTKLLIQPNLRTFFLSASLWCLLDGGIMISTTTLAQVPIKLPQEYQPTLEKLSTEPSEAPVDTFNFDNPPPNPQPVPSFDPVTSPQLNVYRLDSGDGVSITVPLYPEFSTVGTLDAEGNLIMPIMGRVALAGLTIPEVESKIAYELGTRFLNEPPKVLATLTLTRPAQITILGEVVRPGFYSFVAGSPITNILQAAGGSTKGADLRSIVVRRSLRDGTLIEQKVDLYSALIDGKQLPPVFLQGGDTVIVSQLQPGEDQNYDQSLVANSTLPQQAINIRILFPSGSGTSLRNLVLPSGSTFIDAVASLPASDNLLIKEEIALLRFDPDTGGIVSQTLDTKEVLQANSTQNVPLQDEDVIVVSRTLLGKVFDGFNTITRPIRSFFGFRAFFESFLN